MGLNGAGWGSQRPHQCPGTTYIVTTLTTDKFSRRAHRVDVQLTLTIVVVAVPVDETAVRVLLAGLEEVRAGVAQGERGRGNEGEGNTEHSEEGQHCAFCLRGSGGVGAENVDEEFGSIISWEEERPFLYTSSSSFSTPFLAVVEMLRSLFWGLGEHRRQCCCRGSTTNFFRPSYCRCLSMKRPW